MSGFLRFCSLWLVVCVCMGVSNPSTLHAQGFGASKNKITLHRKLPPVAHLHGSSIRVEVAAHGFQEDIAVDLQRMLETELMKDDVRLHTADRDTDSLISCTVTAYSQPTPTTSTQTSYIPGSKKPESETLTRYTGMLSVAYQAKDGHSGQTLDSDNIIAKYDDEFGKLGSTHQGFASTFTRQWGKLKRGKTEGDSAPTPADVRNHLLSDVVGQIASRLVNTNEAVEVYLARGKLDDANKQAEAGLWTRYRETLETMPALVNKEDDAYRLYNIGVAYEELAYESEDPKAASKFLQEASVQYGKAIDDKPSERYFLEPQKRIETAIAHYKKLHDQLSVSADAGTTRSADVGSARSVEPPHEARSSKATSARSTGAGTSTASAASGSHNTEQSVAKTVSGASAGSKASSDQPLTNEQVIQLFKADLDEQNIIDTIRTARRVDFDLSVNGEIKLAQNGVKGKILSAMKERARRSAGR